MTTKTGNIINWSLTGLVGLIFIGSAMSKLLGGKEAIQMAEAIGLSAGTFKLLGVVELVSVLLFMIPRTGMIGTLLLVAYMGGAIATHLSHGQSILAPVLIQAFIWVVALFRFSELKHRMLNANG